MPQKSQQYQKPVLPKEQIKNTSAQLEQIQNNFNKLNLEQKILSNEYKNMNYKPNFNFREDDSYHYISINNTITDSYQRYNIPLDFDLYRIKLNFTGKRIVKKYDNLDNCQTSTDGKEEENTLIPTEILDISIPKYSDASRQFYFKSIYLKEKDYFKNLKTIYNLDKNVYLNYSVKQEDKLIILLNNINRVKPLEIIEDLGYVVFFQREINPWNDLKYNKRILRYLFFVYLYEVFQNKEICKNTRHLYECFKSLSEIIPNIDMIKGSLNKYETLIQELNKNKSENLIKIEELIKKFCKYPDTINLNTFIDRISYSKDFKGIQKFTYPLLIEIKEEFNIISVLLMHLFIWVSMFKFLIEKCTDRGIPEEHLNKIYKFILDIKYSHKLDISSYSKNDYLMEKCFLKFLEYIQTVRGYLDKIVKSDFCKIKPRTIDDNLIINLIQDRIIGGSRKSRGRKSRGRKSRRKSRGRKAEEEKAEEEKVEEEKVEEEKAEEEKVEEEKVEDEEKLIILIV